MFGMEETLTERGGTRLCAVFPTVHQALKLDEVLGAEGVPHGLIPTPRWISDACGLAVSFAAAERGRVEELARRAGIAPAGIFPVVPPGGGAG